MAIASGKSISRRAILALFGMAAIMPLAVPAAAQQFSDGHQFLDAVRKRDGNKVVSFVEAPGSTIINVRDRGTGDTALTIVVDGKDLTWTGYLLAHGARTDIVRNDGRFALMIAVEDNFAEGAQDLLDHHADVNQTNSGGETALIRAVQLKNVEMVRLLLKNGADPDRHDNLAGLSARDYAQRNGRNDAITDLLNNAKPVAPRKGVQGPSL